MTEISLLLGARFFVNKGYPTANALNSKIVNLKPEEFDIASQGSLYWITEENAENPVMTYYVEKMFCLELIAFYGKKNTFNYEEFYDYYANINQKAPKDADFEAFGDNFRAKYCCETDNHNLLSRHNRIFNPLISAFIDDDKGKKFYDEPYASGNVSRLYRIFTMSGRVAKTYHITC